jgi:hypothetical protein
MSENRTSQEEGLAPAAASENLLRIKFFDQFTVALIDYFSLDL